MQAKPHRWNISPALVNPVARNLWKGLAFLAPLWGGVGKGTLLGPHGGPLNIAPTANGTLWRGTPYGVGLGNSNDAEHRRLLFSGYAPVTTSDGAGTGDFTVLMLANPRAEARIASSLKQRLHSGNFNQAGLDFNTDANGTVSSGSFAFTTYNTAWSNVAVAGAVDGNWHLFGGVRRNGVMAAWRDGVLRATTSPTLRNVYSATADTCIGGVGHDAQFGMFAGDTVALAAAWNRALSDAEMRLLARDPFVMFRPAPEWRGVWTLLGGAVLSPVDLTDSFGFETPVFSQAHNLSVSDAAFALGHEAPAISQSHNLAVSDAFFAESFEMPVLSIGGVLSPAKSVFAASFEAAGILQAHILSAQKANLAFPFESAALAMSALSTPDFRTTGISNNLRRKNTAGDTRNSPVVAANRTKSITE